MSRYGLVYLFGFLLMLWFARRRRSFDYALFLSSCAAVGAIAGGRLGYVLFYEWSYYSAHLTEIPALHKGGMSFHGGLLGAPTALYWADAKDFFKNLDCAALCALIVIPIGRLVNFYNGELWGTPSTMPWAVIFLGADLTPRHPVQLYEAAAEGPLAALCLYLLGRFKKGFYGKPGTLSCCYGLCYSAGRFVCEIWREADRATGLLPLHLTMGQVLCLLLFALSLFLLWRVRRRP